MRKVPPAFAKVVASHRHRLEKVLTAQSVSKMRGLYEEAQAGVQSKLRSLVRGGKDTFTAHQQRIVLSQLRQGQAMMSRKWVDVMRPLSRKAQEASLHGLIDDVARLSKTFTGSEVVLPVREAATFAGVIEKRAPSLLRLHQKSVTKYGADVVQKVERELSLSLLRGDSMADAYDVVAGAIDGAWWQGERIVRTELSYAYNLAHRDGVVESAKEIPEIMQRWEEHCDEAGMPLDDRVAVDSIAMHGQVTSPGGLFKMPRSAPHPDSRGETEVPGSLVGLSWEAPPNRPNDRAVLSPWMQDWGVPGWVWRGGSRVWLVK